MRLRLPGEYSGSGLSHFGRPEKISMLTWYKIDFLMICRQHRNSNQHRSYPNSKSIITSTQAFDMHMKYHIQLMLQMELMNETNSYLTNTSKNRNYFTDYNSVKLPNQYLIQPIRLSSSVISRAVFQLALLFIVLETGQTSDTHWLIFLRVSINLKMNKGQKYIMYKNLQGGFRNRLFRLSLLLYGSLETMQLLKMCFALALQVPPIHQAPKIFSIPLIQKPFSINVVTQEWTTDEQNRLQQNQ